MDQLLPYYERELSFFHEAAAEFATKYPNIGRLLQIDKNRCDDPHTERFIQAAALLAARVHHELDAEYPLITESLLGILYPHYLRPIPSFSIAQLELDEGQVSRPDAYVIPRGTTIHTRPEQGTTYKFRTCFDTALWPIHVADASFSFNMALLDGLATGKWSGFLKIEVRSKITAFRSFTIDRLRFYVDEAETAVSTLYELLFKNARQILVRPAKDSTGVSLTLPDDCLKQVGFARDEGVLPWYDRSFLGYRHVQEYFAFPQKFFFFDVTGLEESTPYASDEGIDIIVLFEGVDPRVQNALSLERAIGKESFHLGCTPVVNLFDVAAEPITITHKRAEYRIVPDLNHQEDFEIYSVDEVTSAVKLSERQRVIHPFYAIRHAEDGDAPRRYWCAARRPSKYPQGTDVYLSFVDLDFEPSDPELDVVAPRLTCTNRNYAANLSIARQWGEFVLESGTVVQARCLLKPTKTVPAPYGRGLQWRLISHLALNHLSLVEGNHEALREILMLYNATNDSGRQRQIAAIAAVSSKRSVASIASEQGIIFAMGTQVLIELDEQGFVDTGMYLFASVLDRFLGLYAALNSFTQLTVTTKRGAVNKWPRRSGEQILL